MRGIGGEQSNLINMKDLFEYYDEQPIALQKITSEMEQNVDGFNYAELKVFQASCESIGYTFDYDLSAEPFNLRKFDPNDLTTKDIKQKLFNQIKHTL